MKENDIDKIFRNKLAEFETTVEPEVWGTIESALDREMPVPVKGVRIHFLSRQVYYGAAAVAAVALLFLLLWKPEKKELQIESGMAVVEQVDVVDDVQMAVGEKHVGIDEVAIAPESVVEHKETAKSFSNLMVAVEVQEVDGKEEMEMNPVKEEDEKETGKELEKRENELQWSTAYSDRTNTCKGVEEIVGKKKGKEYAFALASNFISSSNVSVSPQYLNYMSVGAIAGEGINSIEQISQTQYSLPINVALQAQVKINDLLQVGVGISYTNLRSKYEALINKKFYHVKQNLNYIGVPVNLYFTFIGKRYFTLYANVGGSIERGVAAVYRLSSYDVAEHRESVAMKGFQYSANLGFGMEYKFVPEIGIYLEPNVVYYFNSDMPASIRTDQPLQIKAEVGFRFHLNNR